MAIGSVLGMFSSNSGNSSTRYNSAPRFNSIVQPLSTGSAWARTTLVNRKKKLMSWYKKYAPELTALANIVAGDVLEEDYFEPVNPKESGRNKIKAAEDFALNINLKQQDFSTLIDILITGEGYGWLGLQNVSELKQRFGTLYDSKGYLPELKELAFKANFTDEDLVRPQDYRYIASSSVENLYSDINITGFMQRVAQVETEYSPEKVIHYMFYNIDGQPEGFTSILTMVTQFELLRFMWQNMYARSKNGNSADRIFSAKDMDMNSPNFARVKNELSKFVNVEKSHGALLLGGDIGVQELSQVDSMQFEQMGLYITSLAAMQWRIPRNKIPLVLKNVNTKEDAGGGSEKSYWSNIEFYQDIYLNLQNKFLWIPHFGVRRKFKKGYKHDELLEVQTEQTRLNNLTFRSNELAKVGKKFTSNYLLRYMNRINESIDESDLEDIPKEEVMPEDNSNFRQGLESNKDLNTSQNDKNKSDAKKKSTEGSQQNGNGTSGFGKEEVKLDYETKTLKQHIEGKESQYVPLDKFIEFYNIDKSSSSTPLRVFISSKDKVSRLVYKSTDFAYETLTPTSEITPVMLMNFRSITNVDEEEIVEAIDVIKEDQD